MIDIELILLFSSVPGVFNFAENEKQIKQSDKKLVVQITRRDGTNGRVVVPWFICSCDEKSLYKVIKKTFN